MIALLGLSMMATMVRGQATASETPSAAPAAATEAAAHAKAAFEHKFKEYKAIVREIEKLQAEYQSASESEATESTPPWPGKLPTRNRL